jgi:hypothetical protein
VPNDWAYGLVDNRALSPAEAQQNRQALKSTLVPRGITLPRADPARGLWLQ